MPSGDSCNSLIIQTAYLGDAVLTLPLVSALKSAGHRVSILCRPEFSGIFEDCPDADRVLVYNKKRTRNPGERSLIRLVLTLKKEKFTHVFLPQRSFRSGLAAFLARIPVRSGFTRGGGRFFINRKTVYDWGTHEVLRILSLAEAAGIESGAPRFSLRPRPELVRKYRGIFGNAEHLVGFAPGSNWPTKRWPAERFSETAGRIPEGVRAVFLGKEPAEGVPPGAVDLTGKTSVRELTAAVSLLDLLVSNDSGIIHVAAALGVRVCAVFGPTVPGMGFSPYGDGHILIENRGLECRPCGLHGPRRCPEKHFRCMKDIPAERVLEKILKLL